MLAPALFVVTEQDRGIEMEFNRSFFEAEVRDGFYVTAEMKQVWAAQLEVLNDVDKICWENGIQYFAEWGTLLGAVRHHGFIPWDDDMDICMKRSDYNRFLQIAEMVMPSNYKLYTLSSDSNDGNMISRIINTDKIALDIRHLKKYHGVPYIVGLDIFPLDYISNNKEDDELQRNIIKIISYVIGVMRGLKDNQVQLDKDNLIKINMQINQIENLCGVKINREADIVRQLNILIDRMCGIFTEDEADDITIMMLWTANNNYKFPKEYYNKSIRIPFENTTIPVPYAYDTILKKKYGDYMKLVHTWDSHDYPFYESQKKVMENAGIDVNRYMDSYENYIHFKNELKEIRNNRKLKNDRRNKKTVVFMPFKAKYWNMMAGLWKEYERRGEYTILVMPLPYFYKNTDETVQQYIENEKYPDYVDITFLEEYDIYNENPYEIIIQNPYDNYNVAATISPEFYVKKIAKHTNKLTYVPYFITEEINEQDMRAYISMDSYVTMPGVVYADRVVVQSEGIKALYVKKLTEFFGAETKEEWEAKIDGKGALYIEKEDSKIKYNRIPSEWKVMALKDNGGYKKIILYFVSVNGVLEHKGKMFEKVGRSMAVFAEYQSDVMPLLAFEGNMEDILELEDAMLLMDYKTILRKYEKNIVRPDMLNKAVDICDAFYGDAGAEAQICRNQGKPVMIEDIDI